MQQPPVSYTIAAENFRSTPNAKTADALALAALDLWEAGKLTREGAAAVMERTRPHRDPADGWLP